MAGKIFFMTFVAVFLAELADKTQLVGMGMAAKSGRPILVWLGSCSAYIIVTFLSVFIGVGLAKFIRPELIRYLGASLFLIISVLIFFKVI